MNAVKEKIIFVIGAPLPTSKAYGVTTKETLRVLIENDYNVKVISNKGNYSDAEFSQLQNVLEFFPNNNLALKLITFGNKGKKITNIFCWRLGTILNSINSFKMICDFNPDLIWVRDPYLAYLYLKKFNNLKLILEIHDTTGKFIYKKLSKYKHRIKFCPISELNNQFIANFKPHSKIILSPMGVRLNQISTEKECSDYINSLTLRNFRDIKIGYVGRIAPNGYSKGVEELFLLAKYYARNRVNSSITIIGAEKNEIDTFFTSEVKSKLLEPYIKVLPHVSHNQAIERMKDFDILVLPLYRSSSYNGMPIKLLEYIASGRITIMADTPIYTTFFTDQFIPFLYKPFNTESLADTINSALRSPNLKSILLKGLSLASEYTWEKRTLRILES